MLWHFDGNARWSACKDQDLVDQVGSVHIAELRSDRVFTHRSVIWRKLVQHYCEVVRRLGMTIRDGRTLDRTTLEELRRLAVERMRAGERPADVAVSFGVQRSWAYTIQAAARGRGRGLRVLRVRKATGRPRTLTSAQERLVFR